MNYRRPFLRLFCPRSAALLGLILLPSALFAAIERTTTGEISSTIRSVRIDHRSGPVTITGVDSGFGWSWTMSCSTGNGGDADAYLKDCQLDVKQTAGTLQMDLLLPERNNHGGVGRAIIGLLSWTHGSRVEVRSQLVLRVPHAVALDLKNRFGTTQVSALTGSVTIEGQNGRVELEDLKGRLSATTSFAPLHANRIGAARLRNQNGAIDVSDADGELKAVTSFAVLEIHRVKGPIEIKNQNGRIEITEIDGPVIAATSFARLEARDIRGSADLKNQNGLIEARGITGNVTAATSFADLKVADIGGKASLRGQNGRLEAMRVTDDLTAVNSFGPTRAQQIGGRADLNSHNGDIVAQGVEGDLRANTSFARMELDAPTPRIDARNQNASVQITARSGALQHIVASATFAPIDLHLAADAQPLIRATTSFGQVHSDYPVLLADSDAKFYGDAGRTKIDLRGQNGDIRIHALAAR